MSNLYDNIWLRQNGSGTKLKQLYIEWPPVGKIMAPVLSWLLLGELSSMLMTPCCCLPTMTLMRSSEHLSKTLQVLQNGYHFINSTSIST